MIGCQTQDTPNQSKVTVQKRRREWGAEVVNPIQRIQKIKKPNSTMELNILVKKM